MPGEIAKLIRTSEEPESAAAPESDASLAEMAGKPAPEKVTYSMSSGLSAFLGANRIGLAISSYQSGKFYLLGQNVNGGPLVDKRFFRKPWASQFRTKRRCCWLPCSS